MTETKRKYTPPTGRVISFKLTLNPTPKQINQFQSHVGAVRYVYNWTLDLLQKNYEAVKADPSVERVPISHTPILKLWTQAKNNVAPWWGENAKEAYDTGILNAVKSYQNFFNSLSGKRKGPKMGYPRFKKRSDQSQIGCMFNGIVRLNEETKHVHLSRIGKIAYHGDTKSVKWLLHNGARITQGWLKYNHTRWELSLTLRVPDELAVQYYRGKYKRDVHNAKQDKKAVGVDLGLKSFATQSDGFQLANPRFLRKAERKLKREQRSLARKRNSFIMVTDERTGKEYKQWSNRRIAQQKQVAKTHARVYNLRNDFTHQYSTWLVKNYDKIAVEDLNVSGLLRNRNLSKSIQDASWGGFLAKLKYKVENTQFLNTEGVELYQIGRFEPSSKTCCRCGVVRAKLPLSERIFVCYSCGHTMDRDLNAAINIQVWGISDDGGVASEVTFHLDGRVAGEYKLEQTGAYKLSPAASGNHSGSELVEPDQGKLLNRSDLAMHTSTFTYALISIST